MIMTVLLWILTVFAVARIADLITTSKLSEIWIRGPIGQLAFSKESNLDDPETRFWGAISHLINCFECTSGWVAIVATLVLPAVSTEHPLLSWPVKYFALYELVLLWNTVRELLRRGRVKAIDIALTAPLRVVMVDQDEQSTDGPESGTPEPSGESTPSGVTPPAEQATDSGG